MAGPGSGKTAVITHRTKYLIEEAGIPPKHILVITFTKAAAKEMQERFQSMTQGKYTPCTFGTFHSVFFRILQRAYGYTAAQVLPEERKRNILTSILHEMQLEYEDEEEFLQEIISEITRVKSEYIDLRHYYSTSCGEEEFRRLFRTYESTLQKEHQIDFDDMLVYTYELLNERKDICRMWQRKYRYILIDEFQDINRMQYEIIRLLAGASQNVFAVGDDDQSIYRFRGAKPDIMLGFPKDFQDTKQIVLHVNYRSTREIIEGSQRVIANNQKRFPKQIQASRPYECPIYLHTIASVKEAGQDIRTRIQEYQAQGVPYQQMAVLYRTNTQARRLVEKLMEYHVPFRMRDRLPNCYEHWIAKQMIAYIRIASGSRERADFLQIWNRPIRYLRREWLSEPTVDLDEIIQQNAKRKWAVEALQTLQEDIEAMSTMRPQEAIRYIRKVIGYDAYLEAYANERRIHAEELTEFMDEIQAMAEPYPDAPAWFAHIREYGTRLETQRMQQEQRLAEDNAVTLSTIHSAKGLEYQAVFLFGANEGLLPYKKAMKPEEIEEERRLFYVAMTRAKTYLHIYTLKEHYHKRLLPSRFIEELACHSGRASV